MDVSHVTQEEEEHLSFSCKWFVCLSVFVCPSRSFKFNVMLSISHAKRLFSLILLDIDLPHKPVFALIKTKSNKIVHELYKC